jgi:hypothetical protein
MIFLSLIYFISQVYSACITPSGRYGFYLKGTEPFYGAIVERSHIGSFVFDKSNMKLSGWGSGIYDRHVVTQGSLKGNYSYAGNYSIESNCLLNINYERADGKWTYLQGYVGTNGYLFMTKLAPNTLIISQFFPAPLHCNANTLKGIYVWSSSNDLQSYTGKESYSGNGKVIGEYISTLGGYSTRNRNYTLNRNCFIKWGDNFVGAANLKSFVYVNENIGSSDVGVALRM